MMLFLYILAGVIVVLLGIAIWLYFWLSQSSPEVMFAKMREKKEKEKEE